MNTKFKKKILIEGTIQLLSGLRIGGTSSAMSIGGIDNIIVRNPLDNKPYIPGSSLKGKLRSLIELREGTLGGPSGGNVQHGPSQDPSSLSCKVFGMAADKDQRPQPSRVIVRDGMLLTPDNQFLGCDVPYAEVKTEVVIDRITAAANPRLMERVPAGATFSLCMVVNIWDSDTENEEKEIVQTLFNALLLLQDDYLGGSGSRGYGHVKISINSLKCRSAEYYKREGAVPEEELDPLIIPEALRAVTTS